MPDRSSKRKRREPRQGPEDVNEMAAGILAAIPGALDDETDASKPDDAAAAQDEARAKEAAAALGRRGGLKGGKARAEKLSGRRRSEIAKKAAKARWSKERP